MESCLKGGDYCNFHNFILEESKRLTSLNYYSEINCNFETGKTEWVWNEDTFEYEEVTTYESIDYVKVEQLKNMMIEVIKKLEIFESDPSRSIIDVLKEDLSVLGS